MGSTRASNLELETHTANATAARTRTAIRLVANGESLVNAGRAEQRARVSIDMIACRPHSAGHDAGRPECVLALRYASRHAGGGIVTRTKDERVRDVVRQRTLPRRSPMGNRGSRGRGDEGGSP